ncbi:MAG: ABC transporter permease [Candidatus Woesebacteria bacterium]
MKDVLELIRECFGSLTLNKLRTGLAVLGIVIGIGSVIALISLGQSSQKSIENSIQSLGSNLLTVIPGSANTGGVRGALGAGTTLTLDDALALQKDASITTIANVSPEFSRRSQVTAGANNTNTQITGVYPQYADVHKVVLETGSFVSESDVNALAKVAVLGPTAVTNLFDEGVDPLGQKIRISGQLLTVIGVTEAKGGNGFNNPDDAIYIPLSTAQKIIFGSTSLSTLSVEAKNADVMTTAQDDIGYFLLARHKIDDPASADFSIFSQNDILNTASSVTGIFTTLLGGIAAISLLVGGIGIMNIMLVTVTERTREIGLRKALGAKKNIIVTQFLTEAVILTVVGGVIGMMLGIAISFALAKIINIPFTVSPTSVLLSIGVSGGIGILFGWYPARTAAGLQPIEALRYE